MVALALPFTNSSSTASACPSVIAQRGLAVTFEEAFALLLSAGATSSALVGAAADIATSAGAAPPGSHRLLIHRGRHLFESSLPTFD